MITVLGATGTVGAQLTDRLLAAGRRVRVVGRSAERLRDAVGRGADPVVADAADPDALAEAMRGASAVWTMMPVDPTAPDHHAAQARIGEATVAAIRAADVGRVVALSSVGADLPTGTGFLTALHDQEQRLAALTDREVLMLRPGWFYENARSYLPSMAAQGVVADSLDPDVPVPMVATADVAAAAAAALAGEGWGGHAVRELVGPDLVDQRTATRLLGAAFGRELTYLRLDDDAMVAALVEAGFAEPVARQHVGMTGAINEGRVTADRPHASVAPTGYPEFAADLARRTGPLPAA